MQFFFEVLIGGLLSGIMYSFVALGFVLIFKASGVFNFAQGAMVFFAALTFVGIQELGAPFWLAFILSFIAMIALGIVTEKIVLRPLVNQPPITLFMATIGLGFFLEGLAQALWGTQPRGLDIGIPDTPFEVAGIFMSRLDLVSALVAALLVLALVWFFQRTTTGLGLRAVSDDHEAALSVGIPLRQAWTVTWAIAGMVAVVAGVLPARKITRGLGTRLRAGTTGGGVSFGGVWTVVIVVQVALTVMFPAVVMLLRSESNRIASKDAGFPTQEYLGAKVAIDGPSPETMTPETSAVTGSVATSPGAAPGSVSPPLGTGSSLLTR